MSFVLSKLLLFLIKPFTWVLILAGCASLLRGRKAKRRTLFAAVFTLLFFSNAWIFNQFAKISEAPYPDLEQYDVGILLGGFSNIGPKGDIAFTTASDRVLQTILLYRQGIVDKIMISSGSANLFTEGIKEADLAADYLRKIGIPDSAILVENRSRNTQENIRYSFELLEKKNLGNRLLIVTSAWHIPRAKLIVQQQRKFTADFYPTNHLSTKDLNWDDYLIPSAGVLEKWSILIKEWLGYLFIKVRLI